MAVKVDTDPEISPRFRLTSVAFAIRATEADGVADGAVGPADLADNAVTAQKIAANNVVKSINSLRDNVTIAPGANVTITPSGNTLTIAASGGTGGITTVNAGEGLTGGGAASNITLDIGAGPGITTSADAIDLNTSFTDGRYVNENQGNSITSSMIQDGQVTNADIANFAITNSKITGSAVGSAEIIDESVGSADVADAVDFGASNSTGRLQIISSPAGGVAAQMWAFISGGGLVRTFNDNGALVSELSQSNENSGILRLWGPNGNLNVLLSHRTGFPNNGAVVVFDAQGTDKAGMVVDDSGNGMVFGDTKNFRMAHPSRADQEIWYACIEGPEAAAYVRGTAKLINGKASIVFPEHFQIVAQAQGMTVTLTPLDASSKGLAVTAKSASGFEVRELFQGTGNYDFDWEVKSVRKGHENYRVIRSKFEAMPASAVKQTEAK
ncbi:hypothetical protein L0337_45720 [candidate division KSB1 bacterium]|nr:hypothetical protein [candidate division KSB1 bacterium]